MDPGLLPAGATGIRPMIATRFADMKTHMRKRILRVRRRRANAALEVQILNIIQSTYEHWRKHGAGRREPAITVGWIKGYLDQARTPDEYRWNSDRGKYNLIRGALGKLKRQGRITSSLGNGLRGRETRCYEPA